MRRVSFLQRTAESSSVLGSGETSCLVTNPITQPKAYVAERSALSASPFKSSDVLKKTPNHVSTL